MWISERSVRREPKEGGIFVGTVTIGGAKPAVLVDGELRETELVCPGPVVLPRAGDEVLVLTSGEGDCLVFGGLGKTAGMQGLAGELVLANGTGGEIRLRADGTIELSGRVSIRGAVAIEGGLTVNGVTVPVAE